MVFRKQKLHFGQLSKCFAITVFFIIGLCFISCKKDSKPSDPVIPPIIDSPIVTPKSPDVYVVGGTYLDKVPVATLWKNGEPTYLTGKDELSALARGVFVSGSDVYVAGNISKTGPVATLWRNGIAIKLSESSYMSFATAVYVKGEDVYVAGQESNGKKFVAKLWKNGVSISLTKGTVDAEAVGFYSIDNNIYVWGFNEKHQGVAWNEAGVEILEIPKTAKSLTSYFDFLNGVDKYRVVDQTVGGKSVIKMLKNNITHSVVSDGLNDAHASAIWISKTDTFVVGKEIVDSKEFAKIWINGKGTVLTNGYYASSIFVK